MVIAVVKIAFSLLIVICLVWSLFLSALLYSVSLPVLILFFHILPNHLVLILIPPPLPIHLILFRLSPLQLLLICLPLHGTIHLRMTFGSRRNQNFLSPSQLHLRFYPPHLLPYFVHLLQPDTSARTSSPPNFVNSRKSLMTISSNLVNFSEWTGCETEPCQP